MKMSCEQHPDKVIGYAGNLKDLAYAVGNMRYDCVVVFLDELAQDIERQAQADAGRSRPQLASRLEAAAKEISLARDAMKQVFLLCKPYMRNSESQEPAKHDMSNSEKV